MSQEISCLRVRSSKPYQLRKNESDRNNSRLEPHHKKIIEL